MLKPTSFTPILALVGIILTMACKSSKNKDTGVIFLGFTILMFGMDTMSASVSGLKNVPQFQQMFLMFENPILGMLAGAVLTAIIQSSSASVGILQALSVTGQVSLGRQFLLSWDRISERVSRRYFRLSVQTKMQKERHLFIWRLM
jgi:phosphate:Na+ symporter